MRDGELEQAIRENYRLWNAGARAELDALFKAMGPAGFTIEYVGAPPMEGTAAMAAMWDEYGGRCTTELAELIVNGHEAAAYVRNHLRTDAGEVLLPSLETYRSEDGALAIRYFHRTQHPA